MTWSKTTRSKRGKILRHSLGGFVLAGALVSTSASAQVGVPETSPGAKGTVGLALLGAESVMTVQAAFGVQPWWAYAIGGGAGAIGGGIGGYFVDQSGNGEVSMALLVGGLVFAVPVSIAVLSATSYQGPPDDASDQALKEAAIERYHLAKYNPTPAVVGVGQDGFKMDIPAVSVSPVFSKTARQIYALPSATAVQLPVFNLNF